MTKRIAWLTLSCLMVVALVPASCRPAADPEGEGQTVRGTVIGREVPRADKKEEKKEVVEAPGPEEPQYGGRLVAG